MLNKKNRPVLFKLSLVLTLLARLADANLLKGRSVTSDYQQITGLNYNRKDKTQYNVNNHHNSAKKRKIVPLLSVFGLHMVKLKSKAGLLSTCMRTRSGQSD